MTHILIYYKGLVFSHCVSASPHPEWWNLRIRGQSLTCCNLSVCVFLNNPPSLLPHTVLSGHYAHTHSSSQLQTHSYTAADTEVKVTSSSSFAEKRSTQTTEHILTHIHGDVHRSTHCSCLSGHSDSYKHFLWGQGYTHAHTHMHTHTKKDLPGETAAVPIRPQVCSNSKLPHRDQSQFISVRLLVTETEALTEVKLTNLPFGKYQPAHILHLYTGEVRRLFFFTAAEVV